MESTEGDFALDLCKIKPQYALETIRSTLSPFQVLLYFEKVRPRYDVIFSPRALEK